MSCEPETPTTVADVLVFDEGVTTDVGLVWTEPIRTTLRSTGKSGTWRRVDLKVTGASRRYGSMRIHVDNCLGECVLSLPARNITGSWFSLERAEQADTNVIDIVVHYQIHDRSSVMTVWFA